MVEAAPRVKLEKRYVLKICSAAVYLSKSKDGHSRNSRKKAHLESKNNLTKSREIRMSDLFKSFSKIEQLRKNSKRDTFFSSFVTQAKL